MEIVSLEQIGTEAVAFDAAAVLKSGGVILFPTDTLYGLGADAFSDEAVGKIYAIKGRDEKKPIHAIVADIGMASEYGVIDDTVKRLSEKLPKGKVTFVVKKQPHVQGGIANGIDTFGFRIPDNEFCIAIAKAFGKPFTATSGNIAGQKPERTLASVLAQLGAAAQLIDIAFDAGDPPAGGAEPKPSSVVDVSGPELRILREGAISAADIRRALAR